MGGRASSNTLVRGIRSVYWMGSQAIDWIM